MRQRILIVDDEMDLRELLGFNFLQAGYTLITASDGAAAIAEAKLWTPAAIILDLNMPGLNGFTVCERLRQEPATRAIPIIILTADSADQSRVLALKLGATAYLTKPFSPRGFIARVAEIIQLSTESVRIPVG